MRRLYTILSFFAVITVITGCQRRDLLEPDDIGQLALIPIHIDWSESRLQQDNESRASVWLFPKDGSAPIENHFQGNITDIVVKAPQGNYAIIIFNETVNDSHWKGVMEFRGTDKFETFGVYLLEDNSALSSVRGGGLTYHQTARALAAWSVDDFAVTKSMIDLTRSRAEAKRGAAEVITKAEQTKAEQMLSKVAVVKPQPMVRSVFVKTKVYNLNSAYGALAKFSGAAQGILLSSGELIRSPVSHLLKMNNRQMEENNTDGTVENRFLTFGLLNDSEKIVVQLSFQMWDESWYDDKQPFDVTEATIGKEEYEIELQLGKPKPGQPEEEDHPVVLPASSVDVGEWDDQFIDVK